MRYFFRHTTCALVAVIATGSLSGAFAPESQAAFFQTATYTKKPLYSHQAVPINRQNILIVGGSTGPNSSPSWQAPKNTQIYNVNRGTWRSADSTAFSHVDATSTKLPNGKILLVGGMSDSGNATRAVEMYNPKTNKWRKVANALTFRSGHSATLLRDGRVLVVGGVSYWDPAFSGATRIAEIYDPEKDRWSFTGPMSEPRISPAITLLNDGRVLASGGLGDERRPLRTAEIYDPATKNWRPVGPMLVSRYEHRATRLPSGQILITGGTDGIKPLRSSEMYDPKTNRWYPVPPMIHSRYRHTSTLLKNGEVLIAGDLFGRNQTEIYKPLTNEWVPSASFRQDRADPTATILPDGRVFFVGGWSNGAVRRVEVYVP